MKMTTILFLTAVSCAVVLGCQSDHDASADPGGDAIGLHDDHVNTGPTATTVTGRVSGFDCAVVGELCPTTHRGGDYTTGVYTDDEAFYFVVNIPQSFMTQYFLETVEVEGRAYPPYEHAVEPEQIHVIDDGERTLVYESGYFIDADGGRATFHEGRLVNGRWVAQ